MTIASRVGATDRSQMRKAEAAAAMSVSGMERIAGRGLPGSSSGSLVWLGHGPLSGATDDAGPYPKAS